jgi:hypothetical protein
MRFFVLIVSLMVVYTRATTKFSEAPTAQPTYGGGGAHFGGYCSDKSKCIEGKCIGPKRVVSGETLGVCVPLKVGDCKRGCIHDPEGGSPCKFFPGACFKCNKGRPRKGICKR